MYENPERGPRSPPADDAHVWDQDSFFVLFYIYLGNLTNAVQHLSFTSQCFRF